MKQINIKKLILPNLPYVFIALFATKVGQAWRLTVGGDLSAKVLHLMDGFAAAFQSALPSFHPIDLCVGIAIAGIIRLIVYVKGKREGRQQAHRLLPQWSTERSKRLI